MKGIYRLILACSLLLLTGCDEETMARIRELQAQGYSMRDIYAMAINPNYTPEVEQTTEAAKSLTISAPPPPGPVCDALQVGPPRGVSCLHCMEPEARAQAKALVVLLEQSCLKNIAINYLVDGTFDFDAGLLLEHMTRLSAGGRRLFVTFYLSNGPSQRQYAHTPINALGTTVSPEEFRAAIQYDPNTRTAYRDLVQRILPAVQYAQTRNGW